MKPNAWRTAIILFAFLSLLAVEGLAQLTWTRDPANPVLDMFTGSDKDPNAYYRLYSVGLYADDTAAIPYRMWFGSRSAAGELTYSISYAISPNKSDWFFSTQNPVLTTGSYGSFDDVWVLDPTVIRVDGEFKMYYSAFDGVLYHIGLATSPDGMHWTKSPANPVITPSAGAWDAVATTTAEVSFDGTTYHMVYSGYDGATYAIGAATSSDGVAWTKHPANPVLTKGSAGSWDSTHAIGCAMTVHEGTYYLFYQGVVFGELGVATSTDGVSWAKYGGNPVFARSGSFENGVGYGAVIIQDGNFELWYSGLAGAEQIGHATSPLTPLAVAAQNSPLRYAMAQNYPNPFNPSTTISYRLKARSAVALRIYNALGEVVATLVDGVEDQGDQSVRWDAAGVASGVYFYRLNVTDAGNPNSAFTSVSKMLLVR